MLNIKADYTRLKIAVTILNQVNATEEQRIHAYRIIDYLTMTGTKTYEKNINFLYGLDKQIALNVISNRAGAINTIF